MNFKTVSNHSNTSS